ncbi:hypothetical protein [Stenotrophomonas sp.]|uniref:hypothetical protein n=1 Tax=Stenotrophomonas sp. TaxID=69392 RepID=UPI001983B9D9|nr:hypothetical protein [Stenotrophomonas sp.]MBD3827305.1 hypothetical protein [Stenotrophomonas sp.]
MADSTSEVPQTLIKLEQLRIRSDIHFAVRRVLSERRRDLSANRKEIEQQVQIEAASFSGREAPVGQGHTAGGKTLDQHRKNRLAELRRHLAAIDAVDAVVAAAYEEAERTSGDVAAFKSAEAHLQKTLADWGLST